MQGTNEPNVIELANQWLVAKAKEEAANKERIRIEDKILPFLEQKKEGAVTTELASGHKVTITNKLSRTMDFDAFARVRDQIPENLRPIKVKEVLDDAGVKWLQNNEPELYETIAPCLTVKPAKPGVRIVAPVVTSE